MGTISCFQARAGVQWLDRTTGPRPPPGSVNGLFRLVVLVVALLGLAAPAAAQTFPKFTGFVVDAANVLPPAVEAELTARLDALQRDTKRQFVVATIPDTQGFELADYGYRLGRAWGVGLGDVDNGAILFVAPGNSPGQRGPRLEVGTGLEPILTDAFASIVINRDMMPRLKAGDVPGAMVAGTDAVIAQLRASPEEAQARLDAAVTEFDRTHRRPTSNAGGGGGRGIPLSLIFWGFIFLFVILPMLRRGGGGRGRRYSRGRGMDPLTSVLLWNIASSATRSSGWGGGGGGFGGGGFGGGGGGGGWGGGGFGGGGGGGFSGGGASGSW